jgi:hypothetical protein
MVALSLSVPEEPAMASSHSVDESVRSATTSLNQLVTIISGLAAVVALTVLMSVTERNGIYGINRLQFVPVLLFTCSIVMLARFYHGNIRHLDEEYRGRPGKAFGLINRFRISTRVAADFVVVISEALIISALSFLIRAPKQYAVLLAVLLILDAIWFFFFHNANSQRSKTWAANNLAFGLICAILGIVIPSSAAPDTFRNFTIAITGLVIVNTIIDVANEFHFYFPSARRGRTVFVAAPFTGMVGPDNVIGDGPFKSELMTIIDFLRQNRYRVISAHLREHWGQNLYPPAQALEADITGISESDVVLALTGDVPSPGVQLEVGAALAMSKPIVEIYLPEAARKSYLNSAFRDEEFSRKRETRTIEFREPRQLCDELESILRQLISDRDFGV